jgi:hypothetical protein
VTGSHKKPRHGKGEAGADPPFAIVAQDDTGNPVVILLPASTDTGAVRDKLDRAGWTYVRNARTVTISGIVAGA